MAETSTFRSRSVIEPLSARRYRVQFTADLELKEKIELARELLRHAHPTGDLAPIVSRALDLLIDDVLGRRFGANARRKGRHTASNPPAQTPSATKVTPVGVHSSAATNAPMSTPSATKATPVDARASGPASAPTNTLANTAMSKHRANVSRTARRAVLERDGLGCSWVDACGVRCGSRAWLEMDHRDPAGKGGSSEPDNLRLLCRAHNLFAAERAYGREHIERMSAQRRQARSIDPVTGA